MIVNYGIKILAAAFLCNVSACRLPLDALGPALWLDSLSFFGHISICIYLKMLSYRRRGSLHTFSIYSIHKQWRSRASNVQAKKNQSAENKNSNCGKRSRKNKTKAKTYVSSLKWRNIYLAIFLSAVHFVVIFLLTHSLTLLRFGFSAVFRVLIQTELHYDQKVWSRMIHDSCSVLSSYLNILTVIVECCSLWWAILEELSRYRRISCEVGWKKSSLEPKFRVIVYFLDIKSLKCIVYFIKMNKIA